jgi:nitrogenase molybdenum-iron protein NifN
MVPLLHGSQGCATYIRRYLISHYKEPIDIASSNFGEVAAVYGGRDNLRSAIQNVIRQYRPQCIGIATTCLTETIGDDVPMYLHSIREELGPDSPELIHVSTPAYSGTHAEGYRNALRAIVDSLAQPGPRHNAINVLCGMASPADLRYLKTIFQDCGLEMTLLPDYSDTLDAPTWAEYQVIPKGGTALDAIRRMGSARATIEFVLPSDHETTAGALLEQRFGVPCHQLPMPFGVVQTDSLLELLETLSERPTPPYHRDERDRLVDSYVDGHKYVFGKRAVVYGEPELVVGLVSLLREIGMTPVLCATGSEKAGLVEKIMSVSEDVDTAPRIMEGADFAEIEDAASEMAADVVIGSSKGYRLARGQGIPLVRVGFPIHDRIDGPRLLHVGYHGAQQLFDRIANALLAAAQDASHIGYSYM